jgi:hypothetical protein
MVNNNLEFLDRSTVIFPPPSLMGKNQSFINFPTYWKTDNILTNAWMLHKENWHWLAQL